MELIEDLFKKPLEDFKNHLLSEENDRILFSGIYGIGKTTFIKYFFQNDNQIKIFGKEKYKIIYLTPVNYSISSNEDVFKYIKSDIIFELLNNLDLKIDENYPIKDTLPFYLMNNFEAIVNLVKATVPKIEKKPIEIADKIQKFYDNYLKYHEEINNVNQNMLRKFNFDLIQKEGSLYEFNPISEIITHLVENLNSNNEVETVLIIDDLDRIDPAHIFRLFNVFASHFDYQSRAENKFGFDKIMFVCDIENIRNIYRNKYGSKVDFNGYIDKFYSKKIFQFDCRDSLVGMIQKVLYSIKYSEDPKTDQSYKKTIGDSPQLVNTIRELIIQGKLNLRSFFKYYEKPLTILNDDIMFPRLKGFKISQFPGIYETALMVEIYGDVETLIDALDFCRKNVTKLSILQKQELLSKYIFILDVHQNMLSDDENTEYRYVDEDTQISCQYKLRIQYGYTYYAQIIKSLEFPIGFSFNKNLFNNIFYFQIQLIKQLMTIGYLK